MPILLDVDDRNETRATNRVVAAVERFIDRLLWGPRQHDDDLLLSLVCVPREMLRENSGEGSAMK